MDGTLLVGVDGSPESISATRWAAEEAVRRGLVLRILHARTWLDELHTGPDRPEELRSATARMLADAEREARRDHPKLTVETESAAGGAPAELLLKAAAGAELVVLGSRGLGGFAGLVVGSVGLGVAAHCERPTVLVRAAAVDPAERANAAAGHDASGDGSAGDGAAGDGAGEVVVGVDVRSRSTETLEFAFRQAELLGVPVRAVHGWMPPAAWGYAGWVVPQQQWTELEEVEGELLRAAAAPLRARYPRLSSVLDCRIDTPAGALVAASAGAALVVVGRRHRPHPFGMHLGPTAHAVLHHAHAPVAVVPHD
ncbi:universal stress protein [Kitasatospora sp. NPDC096147]|uniref:universal stress protein n=1 Tax=Kitasatospora sp. NPDC096147 TaxID=3364093 RepID=UPI0038204565